MSSNSLIAVIVVVFVLILALLLRKKANRKPPQTTDESVAAPSEEKEEITEEEIVAAEEEEAAEESTVVIEEESTEPDLAEIEEAPLEAAEIEELELPDELTEAEEQQEEEQAEQPEAAEEQEEAAIVAPVEEKPAEVETADISLEDHADRLRQLRDKQQEAITATTDEATREQIQSELVSITEALDFLEQSYSVELACRNDALQVLEKWQDALEDAEYKNAKEEIRSGDTESAEQLLDALAEKDSTMAAAAHYQSARLAECRFDLTRAIERYEKAIDLEGQNAQYLQSAAVLARKLYRHKQALNWFGELEKVLAEKDEDSLDLALVRRELGFSTALLGRHKEAGGLYKKAMSGITKLLGSDNKEIGICWYQIGKLQEALGKYEKAEEPYKKALSILEKEDRDPVYGDTLDKLAGLYMEIEMEREAIDLYERLCSFKEASSNPDMASLIKAYTNLAEAYKLTGRYEESEKNYEHSLQLTEELRGKEHPAVGSILQQLTALSQKLGHTDEADAYEKRATAIFDKAVAEQEAAGQQGVNLTIAE